MLPVATAPLVRQAHSSQSCLLLPASSYAVTFCIQCTLLTTSSTLYLYLFMYIHNDSRVSTISQNEMEHSEYMEQLWKSSLKCLISTKCISLDTAHWALHAGTLAAGSFVATKNWLWVLWNYMGGSSPTAVTLTQKLTFMQYGYQHVGLNELCPVIYSLWRSNTVATAYIAVPWFSTVPFCSVK